ncbi:hypothetical protein PsorP6_016211 [Peronosclerospora sorghi]|uniref:Uncharacterized protein n=1 Tax=Peronosclerospora sorghi TaxID=230839 RepID=A0ACC0VN64_9STRA|nr:hypothetical protein PsorP6_016211 [Peronosclerospora sorghi]
MQSRRFNITLINYISSAFCWQTSDCCGHATAPACLILLCAMLMLLIFSPQMKFT